MKKIYALITVVLLLVCCWPAIETLGASKASVIPIFPACFDQPGSAWRCQIVPSQDVSFHLSQLGAECLDAERAKLLPWGLDSGDHVVVTAILAPEIPGCEIVEPPLPPLPP